MPKKYTFMIEEDIIDSLDGTGEHGIEFLDMLEITEAAIALTADLVSDLDALQVMVNNHLHKHRLLSTPLKYEIDDVKNTINWRVA